MTAAQNDKAIDSGVPERIGRLRQVVRKTTFIRPHKLSRDLDFDLCIASEAFQITGSFKFRAAYNLAANRQESLLITASSGNFGQALACACNMLAKDCIVVMPDNSSKLKIELTRSWGARVELLDTKQKTRRQRVAELACQAPQAYLASAYDDDLVIEGNSSLAYEIAELDAEPDLVIVPIGGGGLSAGIIQGLRACGKERIQVLGAEPLLANDAARSIKEGRLLALEEEPPSIADGARTLSLGKRNFEILQAGIAGIIELAESEIKEALKTAFLAANLKLEPTGALSLAAAIKNKHDLKGKRVLCIASGANVDSDLFCKLLQPN